MIEYLRTLPSIRERCGRVHDLAKQGKLQCFDYHPEKEEHVTNYCIRIIRVCQPSLTAPRVRRRPVHIYGDIGEMRLSQQLCLWSRL